MCLCGSVQGLQRMGSYLYSSRGSSSDKILNMQGKIMSMFAAFILLILAACNNADKKHEGHVKDDPKLRADSLYDQLIDEHNVGMKDWMRIEDRKKQITKLLDSLGTLPAKANAGIEEFKNKLREASTGLQTAYDQMDTWMSSMNLDSAKNDLQQRIKYLTEENGRARQVNEAILKSLQKADSLLKVKF